MKTRALRTALALALPLMVACSEERPGPAAPRFDLSAGGTISGALLGPDGTSLCHFVPDGTGLIVRVLNPPPAPVSFAGSQFLNCPDSNFAIPVAAGTYLLRLALPPDPGIGSLPLRYLVTTPVVVDGADVSRNIQVLPGTGLGGGVTFDGAPFAGADIALVFDQAPGFAEFEGHSAADGGWIDVLGREPMILEGDARYRVGAACGALGTRLLQDLPPDGFLFPTEVSAINCALTTAPNVAFSHTRTRLAVTPMPGDIGGLSAELFRQFGEGWGVQFPVPAGQSPVHAGIAASHLFRGGLVVGLRPDRLLSGVDLAGYGTCPVSCRDFGLDGNVTYTSSPRFGTKVLWRYSDAPSPNGVGLKVLQQSYDGVPPNDYVLFHFILTNSGSSTLTFNAGMFADWDIGVDPTNDVGFTAMDGRLMYQTDVTPGGVYAGTLLLGQAPISGNVFFDGTKESADFVAALAGDVSVPAAPDPDDHRYLQALGPITLKPDHSVGFWIAVVAGEDQGQLFANANAAAADVARRSSDQ